MNISDILKDSFKFPVSNWKRFLILGIIILASSLFSVSNLYFGYSPYMILMILPSYILIFFYRGYLLRVIKVSASGDNELPGFYEWIQIFIDGLKVFLVSILYYIIPVIVLMAGFFLTFDLSSGKFGFGNLNPTAMIVLSIGSLLYILFTFFYDIGLANMAYQGKLEAALSFSEIKEIIRKIGWKKYLALFIVLLLIMIVSTVISYLAGSISLIGVIIVGILVSPYLTLISNRAIGLIYKESL